MHHQRFDRLTKALAGRLSRRRAIAHGAAGSAAVALAGVDRRHPGARAAQPATPAPGGTPTAGAGSPALLFVQTFQAGSFAPEAGAEGVFTLTLTGGHGHTVYFSDRPDRTYGMAPTPRFFERMDFGPANPPNAALVLQAAPDDEMVVVLELTAPSYDEADGTVTYRAAVLTEFDHLQGVVQQRPVDHLDLPARFGAANLFIDSARAQFLNCCEADVECISGDVWRGTGRSFGKLGPVAHCGGCSGIYCRPCDGVAVDALCNATFPDCNGACHWREECSENLGC